MANEESQNKGKNTSGAAGSGSSSDANKKAAGRTGNKLPKAGANPSKEAAGSQDSQAGQGQMPPKGKDIAISQDPNQPVPMPGENPNSTSSNLPAMPKPSDTFSRGLRAISKDARPEDFDELQGLYSIMYMERKAERFFKRDPNTPQTPEDSMTAGNKAYNKSEGLVFPFRGREAEKLNECTKSDAKAFLSAAAMYKELSRHLWVPRLLRQLVGTELHYYDPIDMERDRNAHEGVIKSNSHTFGYTQVSINAVKLYVLEFPTLRQFFERKGHKGQDYEIRALLDPECAAMIAAAVCEHHTRLWKDQKDEDGEPIIINEKTLAYGYNPDVYDVNDTLETSPIPIYGARKILTPSKRVIETSMHVKRVFEQDY